MNVHFKVTSGLLEAIHNDLGRRHPYAMERVGFITCRFANARTDALMVLSHSYHPVADEDYIDDRAYGALIDSSAFRKAMQLSYAHGVGLFHVHMHGGRGKPLPSSTDMRESARFVPDFFHVQPKLPHGALILSSDSISGRVWLPSTLRPEPIDRFSVVGVPLRKVVS